MTTQASTQTAAAPEAAKGPRPTFYTRPEHKGAQVALWISTKTAEGAPDMEGSIGGVRVAGYLHQGPSHGFFSFIDSTKGKDAETGYYTQVATANVVAGAAGVAKLVVKQKDVEPNWVEVSLDASQDMLVAAGLDLEIQATKKAAHAADKAAGKAAAPAADAPAQA